MAHHQHPYAVQTAAMYLSCIPALGVLALMIGARMEELRRRVSPATFRPKAQFGHGHVPGFEALSPE